MRSFHKVNAHRRGRVCASVHYDYRTAQWFWLVLVNLWNGIDDTTCREHPIVFHIGEI